MAPRKDREEKMLRKMRSEEERKALGRMAEIAESGGLLITWRDIEDALLALRATGRKFDPVTVWRELERAGWIGHVEGKVVVKKPIPLPTLGRILQGLAP